MGDTGGHRRLAGARMRVGRCRPASLRSFRSHVVPLLVLTVLAGCVANGQNGAAVGTIDPRYPGVRSVMVNGQAMSPEQALDATTRQGANVVAQIPSEQAPIATTARIVIPDHDRMRPIVLQVTHQANTGVLEFTTEQQQRNVRETADLIVHSNIFQHVTIVEQNDTVAPDPAGADYLVWFQVRSIGPNNAGPWVSQWLIKRANAPSARQLAFDMGTAAGVPRLESFLTSLKRDIAALNGAPGAGPPNGARVASSSGSGIVINARGDVLTNNHVAGSCTELHVIDASHASVPATLVGADAANDLALLRTGRSSPTWAHFRDDHGLRPGESVVVTGYPLSGLLSPDMAVTTGSLTALAGMSGDSRQLQISAPVQPGNSGGPVLDDSGRVIGVTTAVLNSLAVAVASGGAMPQNVNFAIKTTIVRAFLEANGANMDGGAGHPGMSPPFVGDLARGFTVKVECGR